MINDVRFAVRALRRSPGFTVVAVVTLALGIGANTALFSVADAVLLKPLPYPEPERIIKIEAGPVSFTKTSITASRQMEQSSMFAGAGTGAVDTSIFRACRAHVGYGLAAPQTRSS